MNILKISIATLAILTASIAVAQDSKTVFSGNADFYYRFDFANAGDAGFNNNFTSFTNSQDSFELGMASIKVTHKEGKASVFADLGFGNRAKEFTYNDAQNEFMVKQLNMTYEFSDKFKVIAGGFATHLGFELVDAVDNKNYSMSYAFTNGPFFNTGLKAQYTEGKFSIMAGVTNPTDFKTALKAGTNQKTIIAQLGYTVDSGSAYLNFTKGSNNPSDVNNLQIDLVATKKINDKFTLGFNGTYATVSSDIVGVKDANWYAAILYAQMSLSKDSSLAYRFEYFNDKEGIKLPIINTNVIANTLSLNVKEGRFTFIPEVRFDMSSKQIFKSNNAGGLTKSAASVLLATTYSF